MAPKTLTIVLLALGALFVSGMPQSYAGASGPGAEQTNLEPVLKRLLQGRFPPQGNIHYSVAFSDLHDDGHEDAIVYISGPDFCGSGGCLTLILEPVDNAWRVLGRMTVTNKPIRVLATKTQGWHNIGIFVRGGGIQPGYEALVPFSGKKYASNPTVSPARAARAEAGKIVIAPNDDGQLLSR